MFNQPVFLSLLVKVYRLVYSFSSFWYKANVCWHDQVICSIFVDIFQLIVHSFDSSS